MFCLAISEIHIISEVLLHKLWALESELSECDRKLAKLVLSITQF